jgi:hypothetical protein
VGIGIAPLPAVLGAPVPPVLGAAPAWPTGAAAPALGRPVFGGVVPIVPGGIVPGFTLPGGIVAPVTGVFDREGSLLQAHTPALRASAATNCPSL